MMKTFTLREWFFVLWLLGCTLATVANSFRLHNMEHRQDRISWPTLQFPTLLHPPVEKS